MKYKLIKHESGFFRVKALKNFGDVSVGDLGGFVEFEKNLSQEGNCWVYDNARVYDDARVYDNARVFGNAKVFDNAWVYDNARVFGNAKISGNAKVSDNAKISGNAKVSDNAWVYGYAKVSDNAWVYSNAWVSDDTKVSGHAEVSGYARVSGNAKVSGNLRIGMTALIQSKKDIYVINPVGPKDEPFVWYTDKNYTNGICVFNQDAHIPRDEAEKWLKDNHSDTIYGDRYRAAMYLVDELRSKT